MKPIIQVTDLKKQFGSRWITRGVTLSIYAGKTTIILGRSGEGKSVLLKQLIGLLQPTSGEIIIDGVSITDPANSRRYDVLMRCGYVFQFAALLDSLTVFENIGITLIEAGKDYADVLAVVKEKLALVNLAEEHLFKYPSELSGGMRKRVGLARTLVANPEIILYDEPTTGLDPITSRVIHELMFDMQQRLGVTSVIISHDIESFKYADYIALLHNGVIEYFGEAQSVWESTNPYIYQFIRGLATGPITNEIIYDKDRV